MVYSLYALFNLRCEHSDLKYMKRFDALLRVFEAQGGWFHTNYLDYETAHRPETAKDDITFYQELPQEHGFQFNPYDPCVPTR